MRINKNTYDNSSNSIFHSNGMAQVAAGDSMGASSGISFEKRLTNDVQRSVVKSYRHSVLGSRTSELRAKRFEPTPISPRDSGKDVPQRAGNRPIPPRAPYNPYA